jgi:hypothetical protein
MYRTLLFAQLWCFLFLVSLNSSFSQSEAKLTLIESFPTGYRYSVRTAVQLAGQLTVPTGEGKSQVLAVSGESTIEYDERILPPLAQSPGVRTLRLYRTVQMKRKVGDKIQEASIRPEVRRLVILRQQQTEVPFSPDGPLTWGELDVVRTDVFTPALVGLLPDEPVRPGDRWTATNAAVQELTDLEKVEKGKLVCEFLGYLELAGRRHAHIQFAGVVEGVNEDGPNRQDLRGRLYFDLDSKHISYVSLDGTHTLLDANGKEVGSIRGQFTLTRQANVRPAALADEVVRGLVVDPNAQNTSLLYDNPDIGIRFIYPRRWRVGMVRNQQVALEEPGGSSLLITAERPEQVPTPAAYLNESEAFIKQQGKVIARTPPRRLRAAPHELDTFTLEVDFAGRRLTLDYYVVRSPEVAATIAVQLTPNSVAVLRPEVEQIARSLGPASRR